MTLDELNHRTTDYRTTQPKRPARLPVEEYQLGRLTNRKRHSGDCEPWNFGITELFESLMRRKGAR